MLRNWQPSFFAIVLAMAPLPPAPAQSGDTTVTGLDIARLLDTIGKSDRVEVFAVTNSDVEERIYASREQNDLATLKESIKISPLDQSLSCACDPSIVIRLYRKGDKSGELDVIKGDTLRFSSWQGDARIAETKRWFQWLDDRGITQPRKEFAARQATADKSRIAEARWLKAMPASIAPLWQETIPASPAVRYETSNLDRALATEYPDNGTRIRRLLEWFGSGAGPWSGFPAYEAVAEQMLLEYSTPELVDAVTHVSLTEEQKEGAARLFAGRQFNRDRPGANVLLPPGLKHLLLEHSLTSTDPDKLGRARQWLASTTP